MVKRPGGRRATESCKDRPSLTTALTELILTSRADALNIGAYAHVAANCRPDPRGLVKMAAWLKLVLVHYPGGSLWVVNHNMPA
eukprot:12177051-Karenia_brevis.AAC.1